MYYRYKIIIEYNGSLYNGWQKQKYIDNQIDVAADAKDVECSDKEVEMCDMVSIGAKTDVDVVGSEIDKKGSEIDVRGFKKDNKQYNFVQQTIEEAIYLLTREKVLLYAAGRTDAGVHAYGQVGHFDLKKEWKPDTLFSGINYFLKYKGVVIINCELVKNDFHARFAAVERGYVYKVHIRKSPVVLDLDRVYWLKRGVNVGLLKKCVEKFTGRYDFNAFRASGCQAQSSVITIKSFKVLVYFKSDDNVWREKNIEDFDDGDILMNCRLEFFISARSFLYKLIRNLVGAVLNVSQGSIDIKNIDLMLKSRQRKDNVFVTASASGLYFLYAKYE